MELLSVEGLIDVRVSGMEDLQAGKLSSDRFDGVNLSVNAKGKLNQSVLHSLIASGKIKTIIFSTDELVRLVPPTDVAMFAAVMDQANIKELRLDRYQAAQIPGGVEWMLDDATYEYVIRRVDG